MTSGAEIRSQLSHPVIDNDGHVIELLPLVRDLLVEEAGESVAQRFDRMAAGARLAGQVPVDARRGLGMTRSAWWGVPTANTYDRATAMLPALTYERLDELGIDLAFLYPTYGLTSIHLTDDELRTASARAFNRYLAEVYAPYRDRLLPVACIPTFTPEEAVAELRYAVGELGLRAVMMGGAIPRVSEGPNGPVRWIDGLGHASLHDYTPVWEACIELGVAPTFHSTGAGWGSRTSPTNYVFNHLGNFAAAGELCARSLLFAGVPKRFPQLRFAFLEGGVAWAANLLSDLIGHYEKRNRDAISHYDPARLDVALLTELFDKHATGAMRDRIARLPQGLSMLSEPLGTNDALDEFAESLVTSVDDLVDVFTTSYFFGCEADDPMTALAFDRRKLPGGCRLPAVFASDVGHWDVPDIAEVLPEAWELVEHGHLDAGDFEAFTFTNPVALWTGANPHIFEGTVVADAVAAALGSPALHLNGNRST